MEVLLDTNAFLWWVTNDPKLSATARTIIANPRNNIFFSIVSAWEIVIKAQIGKLPLPEAPNTYIPNRIAYYQFKILPIEMEDVLQIWQLPQHHSDPFDRFNRSKSNQKSAHSHSRY
jgi:PIN domain nuclease of toxin-antitoxin system